MNKNYDLNIELQLNRARGELEATRFTNKVLIEKLSDVFIEVEGLKNKLADNKDKISQHEAVIRCSFCDATDNAGNPWSGHSELIDGNLIYRVMGCKDHKYLVEACKV